MKLDKIIYNGKLPKFTKMKDSYLLYARKSTESEDKQVASIDNQLELLYQMAEQKGFRVVQTITESRSAKAPGREGFSKLVEAVNNRDDIRGIICWKLNRLSRNPQDSGLLQQLLYDGRIQEIVTPSKTYTETDSDFIMAIESSQAQRFIRDLRDDTRRGIERKLEKGWKPGLSPTGYQNNVSMRQGEKTISPHPIYFRLVRKIFELALTGKFSTQELYIKARQMGIKTASGRPLSRTQIYYILRNPFFTGRFIYKGILYEGSHQPMITDSEFDAVQEILQSKAHIRKQRHVFNLNGFIRCGSCGKFYTGETHTKKSGRIYDYYKCSLKGKTCKAPMISAKDLELQVVEFLKKISIKKAYVDWCIKWVREAEMQDRQVRNKQHEALKAEYSKTTIKLDNLIDSWVSKENEDRSILTKEEFLKHKNKFLHSKKELYRRMKGRDKELNEWTETMLAVFDFSAGLINLWNNGGIEDKKNILIVVGSELSIKNKVLSIKARTPFQYLEKLNSNQLLEANQAQEVFDLSIVGQLLNEARTHFVPKTTDFLTISSVLKAYKKNYTSNYLYAY